MLRGIAGTAALGTGVATSAAMSGASGLDRSGQLELGETVIGDLHGGEPSAEVLADPEYRQMMASEVIRTHAKDLVRKLDAKNLLGGAPVGTGELLTGTPFREIRGDGSDWSSASINVFLHRFDGFRTAWQFDWTQDPAQGYFDRKTELSLVVLPEQEDAYVVSQPAVARAQSRAEGQTHTSMRIIDANQSPIAAIEDDPISEPLGDRDVITQGVIFNHCLLQFDPFAQTPCVRMEIRCVGEKCYRRNIGNCWNTPAHECTKYDYCNQYSNTCDDL